MFQRAIWLNLISLSSVPSIRVISKYASWIQASEVLKRDRWDDDTPRIVRQLPTFCAPRRQNAVGTRKNLFYEEIG